MSDIKEINNFGIGSSQYRGTEEDLLKDEGFLAMKETYDHLLEHKWCHVRILEGDYEGSVAKFTLDEGCSLSELYRRIFTREEIYNVVYSFSGKLSWKGKRNNPKFLLTNRSCQVILNGNHTVELFNRFDLKKEKEKLLQNKIYDIDSNELSVGDNVLYLNMRYGSGGSLCHGKVKDFKAHARDGYVSVIISNDNLEQESECRNPSYQIYKKVKCNYSEIK